MKRHVLYALLMLGAGALVFYLAIAGTIWQLQNPRANSLTFWTHLGDALHFRALPQFQEQP